MTLLAQATIMVHQMHCV